ncbi:vasoactive intestinal polypeptide receptor 1 isoform X3 [Marmota monax]|uniref:vasoactive intestinal polypeptide receptor 1 isoform X3 n=1 Tax=Marmota monax TaxID=9995 RepID=UPI001EB0210A|nr:vasoactive intestinal polypeptide receptor 1 isoform X3 [Marmota monax]
MRPPSPPPARWLCVLAGALACALGPAGGRAARLQQECDYLQMIEVQHKECLEEAQLENETAGCSKMWDNLTCWPATPRGQVVVLACPLIFKLFSPIQGRNVSRSCTDEGWTQLEPGPYPIACGLDDKASSLDEQQQTMFYHSVKTGYTIGYSLSLATLLIATAILSLFRKLHCTRNYIHTHLFVSFILRAAAVFIKDLALFDSGDSDHCSEGSVGCKAAVVFFQYCVMANFFWLLVEGLYLHTLLAVSFFSERKYFWGYILIGWGVPSTFTMVWTIIRIQFEDYGCWDTINSSLWWIIKAPILTSILVNFVLFICIIRILVQKLRPPDIGKNDSSPYSSPGVVPRYTSLSSHRAQEDRDNLCLVRTVYPVPGMCMVQKRGAINAWQMKALGESPVYQRDSHVQTQYYNKDICNLHVLRDLHASSHRIHTVPCKIALQGSGSHDHRQGERGMMSMGQ